MKKSATRSLPIDRCPFDPDPSYVSLREQPSLPRVSTPAGVDVWLVTRYDDAKTVLGEGVSFSNVDSSSSHLMGDKDALGAPPPPGVMLRHDGDEHARLRLRLAREFMVKKIARYEPFIRSVVAGHIDRLASLSQPVDLYREFGLPVPALVISELLGVPEGDREEFERATASQVDLRLTLEERQAAAIASAGFFARLVEHKIASPGDDLLSRLIREPTDRPLDAEELQGIALLLLAAGHDTTANMITLGTYLLLEHPRSLEVLESAVAQGTAVDELIRYLSIVHNGVLRKAVADIEIAGTLIRAGDHVAVVLESANRDAAFLEDGDALDLHRSSAHIGFGYGAHQCLGQHLARLELNIALPELFRRVRGLRVVTPAGEIPFKTDMVVYGIRELMVEWDEVLP